MFFGKQILPPSKKKIIESLKFMLKNTKKRKKKNPSFDGKRSTSFTKILYFKQHATLYCIHFKINFQQFLKTAVVLIHIFLKREHV